MFYIQQDDKIVLFDENRAKLENTVLFTPQYAGLPILETNKEITVLDGEFVFAEDVQDELALKRKERFKEEFFEIKGYGWFRKVPKGYSSAVEAMGAAFNMVNTIAGYLPANTLTFYNAPDFADGTQCTEEWLIDNSYKNNEMSSTSFGVLYSKFLEAWNTEEHK